MTHVAVGQGRGDQSLDFYIKLFIFNSSNIIGTNAFQRVFPAILYTVRRVPAMSHLTLDISIFPSLSISPLHRYSPSIKYAYYVRKCTSVHMRKVLCVSHRLIMSGGSQLRKEKIF